MRLWATNVTLTGGAGGKPLALCPDELHAKHQAWRDRINEIDDEIERLDAIEPEEEVPNGRVGA